MNFFKGLNLEKITGEVIFMWEDILRKKNTRISIYAKRLADEVIDETPRSVNEILDLMYKKIKEERKTKSGPKKRPGSGSNRIPTRGELQYYLSKNYNSIKRS